ncbi:MAG: hypothetical protein WKF58_10890 [Ilumatobacteraceae bacterium]
MPLPAGLIETGTVLSGTVLSGTVLSGTVDGGGFVVVDAAELGRLRCSVEADVATRARAGRGGDGRVKWECRAAWRRRAV